MSRRDGTGRDDTRTEPARSVTGTLMGDEYSPGAGGVRVAERRDEGRLAGAPSMGRARAGDLSWFRQPDTVPVSEPAPE